jgi:hypothetical protein
LKLRSISKTNSPSSLRHNLQSNKTNQKQKHIISKKFGTIEASRRQRFGHQAELGFVTFAHKKHMTFFLGYTPI